MNPDALFGDAILSKAELSELTGIPVDELADDDHDDDDSSASARADLSPGAGPGEARETSED